MITCSQATYDCWKERKSLAQHRVAAVVMTKPLSAEDGELREIERRITIAPSA